jgi:hypothetical protein
MHTNRNSKLIASIFVLSIMPGSAAAQTATPAWWSSFEEGFPGEWLAGYEPMTPGTRWDIVDSSVMTPIHGDHVYRGEIFEAAGESHRGYPVIHTDIPSPLVNRFWVYLDADYDRMATADWIHFATWANNVDWAVHTLAVRDRRLEMAHLSWTYIGPGPQPEFPLRRWVRFTAYIHYDGPEGYVRLWQDGVPIMEGTFTDRSGTNLLRAHWGMYANGATEHGTQYNDDIQIWTLSAPLSDLETEPSSPYDETSTPRIDAGVRPSDAGASIRVDGGFDQEPRIDAATTDRRDAGAPALVDAASGPTPRRDGGRVESASDGGPRHLVLRGGCAISPRRPADPMPSVWSAVLVVLGVLGARTRRPRRGPS